MINQVVLPVAGLGTRFLPASKVTPKEMLPIVDKPLVQYATEEAIRAGITGIVFVISEGKKSIVEHYGRAQELEEMLERKNKKEDLRQIRNILPQGVSCTSAIQEKALGLGHAVLCAKDAVDAEAFAVILPDDLIDDGDRGCLKQMVEVYKKYQCSVIAVETVPREQTGRYGIVSTEPLDRGIHRITGIVEKPAPEVAPSTLAVVGRYLLSSRIFSLL